MIDTHCHLYDEAFDEDHPEVLHGSDMAVWG